MATVAERVERAMWEASTLRDAEALAAQRCPELTPRQVRQEMFALLGGDLPMHPPAPGSLEAKFEGDDTWPDDDDTLTP